MSSEATNHIMDEEKQYTAVSHINETKDFSFTVIASDKDSSEDIPIYTRAQWNSRWEFILSCLGYTVGLGNVVRFPYLAVQNGGGAFLIPYLVFLFLAGVPLMFLEFGVAQYCGLSCIKAFNIAPIFKGLGWCMVALEIVLCTYYNAIIAWVIYYLAMSINSIVPWSTCGNYWNTENCFTYSNASSFNGSHNSNASAASEFWLNNVLEISSGIEDLGGVNWKIVGCIVAAWIITFLCLFKGIKTLGKVVYVTAIAPYILLTVILIRAVTLEGAWIGLEYYFIPDWEKLKDIHIWAAAGTQIFYSLGPAWGGMLTMASYSKFDYNFMSASLYLPVMCSMTSIYAGVAVFGVIGHVLHKTGENNLDAFLQQGPGLTFIAYPEALATLPVAPLWSVLFFLTMLSIGLDTQFVAMEVITSAIFDQFPQIQGRWKTAVTAGICTFEIFIGFVFATRAGFYIYQIIDWYGSAMTVVTIGFLEFISLAYVVGPTQLFSFYEEMLGPLKKSTKVFWIILICVTGPILASIVVITSYVDLKPPKTHNNKEFPVWAVNLGWGVSMFSLIELPIVGGWMIYKYRNNWRQLFKPNEFYLQSALKRRLAHEEYERQRRSA